MLKKARQDLARRSGGAKLPSADLRLELAEPRLDARIILEPLQERLADLGPKRGFRLVAAAALQRAAFRHRLLARVKNSLDLLEPALFERRDGDHLGAASRAIRAQ